MTTVGDHPTSGSSSVDEVEPTPHHALIVDADEACAFLDAHPGWAIFPGRMKWDNGRWLKLPAAELPWAAAASSDPGVVRGLWSTYASPVNGKAPIAVHLGKSGLVVLDTDKEVEDEKWKAVLHDTSTLVLASCTRKMPHYVFLQPPGDKTIVIQDWPGGEVKSQNGYIFVSDLPPISGVLPLEIPQHIVDLLRTSSADSDFSSSVKMSDRDLEIWLSTTECQLVGPGEDEMISELVAQLQHQASKGHRRDAMRNACMTMAIEATAGLYAASKAWDALESAYIDLRNDASLNDGKRGKEWSPQWWKDSRVLLAGAVEKIEAGRFDDAIAEKRDRFGIWSKEDEEEIASFFAAIEAELEATAASPATESRSGPSANGGEEPIINNSASPERATERPQEATEPPPAKPSAEPPVALPHAPEPPQPEALKNPQKPASQIDPHQRLREELARHGFDLDTTQNYLDWLATQPSDPQKQAVDFGKKVAKEIERDLVRKTARSLDNTVVEPTDWAWLKDGGFDAIAEHTPGTMLVRNDGIGLLYDRGCAHLIGDKSVGKSWLATMLAVERMREGETVGWLDYETDEQQVAERFVQAGATLRQVLTQLKYFNMKGESIAGAVTTISQIEPPVTVLIVDSVDASMAASGAEDENSSSGYHAWRSTITPLTESMLCVLIEHTGHENPHRARGASAKGQQADQEFSAVVVKPFSKEESGLVKWTCRKNRRGGVFTTDDTAAFFKISPNGPVMHNGRPTAVDHAVKMELLSPSDPSVSSMTLAAAAGAAAADRAKVLNWVAAASGPVSRAKIRDAVDVNDKAIVAILDELEAEGALVCDRSGRWPIYSTN